MPLHAPPKPEKLKPETAVAARVTEVPELNFAAQAVGQVIPVGLLVTVPLPEMITDNCAVVGGGGGGDDEGVEPPPQAMSREHRTSSRRKRSGIGTPSDS
jgi:hypothetical protein